MNKHANQSEIQISCRLELLPGKSASDKISHARDFGFDAVALPGRYLNEYIVDLKETSDKLPLPFSSISLGFRESLLSSSPALRSDCLKSLIALFELCRELRIPFLNMPPALIQDNRQHFAKASDRDDLLIRQLPLVTEEAHKRGVTLLLEPVNRYESEYLNTLRHAVTICEKNAGSNLGITADLFHMQMEELNVPAAIAAAGKWIKLFHVAENNRQEPGIGSMDFPTAFSALKGIGYCGFLELESRNLSDVPGKSLPRAVEYLRKVWATAKPPEKQIRVA